MFLHFKIFPVCRGPRNQKPEKSQVKQQRAAQIETTAHVTCPFSLAALAAPAPQTTPPVHAICTRPRTVSKRNDASTTSCAAIVLAPFHIARTCSTDSARIASPQQSLQHSMAPRRRRTPGPGLRAAASPRLPLCERPLGRLFFRPCRALRARRCRHLLVDPASRQTNNSAPSTH